MDLGAKCVLLALAGLLVAATGQAAALDVARRDFRVTTEDGVGIFVRELRPEGVAAGSEPVILIHGARVPGIASFDLPVPGGSLATDLAVRTGKLVYIMDARGYGGSDRPAVLDRPPNANPPQARAYQVVRDIAAVAAAAKQLSGSRTVALFGWATGGMWGAFYASLHPEQIGHLVTLNALYGGSDHHPQLGPGSATSDPAHPDRLNLGIGAYARNDAASLLPSWNRSIPEFDKTVWRDPAIVAAYQQAALASDPLSGTQDPAAFRAPMGAIEDSFYQASGRHIFDASAITAPVLVIRSERDFWSRPEDAQTFTHDATHAAAVRIVTLPGATHYVHLDRPERGRNRLIDEVAAFFADCRPNGE